MPDLGPNKRVVRKRPVMVVLRGYDPTQPNKTAFSAPPATYTSTDANFVYSGMVVRRASDGTMVPAVASDMTGAGAYAPSQLGFAFQDANRFDVVNSRLATGLSARSDVEIRTAWYDRSQVYKLEDPLVVGTTPGELTLQTNPSTQPVVGRVSALPRFEGGNPKIGGVNYTYANLLPDAPYASAPAAAAATAGNITAMVAFNTAMNAWVVANIAEASRPDAYPFNVAGLSDTSAGDSGYSGADAANYATFATTGAHSYEKAVAYRNAQAIVRQAASDVSSFQATDNSMITFVTSRS